MDRIDAQCDYKVASESNSLAKELIIGFAFFSLCLSYFFNLAFLLYFPLSIFSLFVNFNFRIKKITLALFSITLFWLVILFFSQASSGFYSWKQAILILCHFSVSLVLYKKTFSAIISYGPAFLLSSVFILFIIAGYNPESIFPNNSKNYISIVLISALVFSVIARKEKINFKVLVLLSFLSVFISIWAGGRGGILISLLMSVALIFLKFSKVKVRPVIFGYLVKSIVVLSVLLLCILSIFFAIQSELLSGFSAKGLESASRIYIWYSYLNELDLWSVIFGLNPDKLLFVERWGGNLHNSYFSAHAYLGLIYLSIILFLFLYIIKSFKKNSLLVVMVACFMARAFTDIGMLSGHFDLLLISSFLYLYTKKRSENEKSI